MVLLNPRCNSSILNRIYMMGLGRIVGNQTSRQAEIIKRALWTPTFSLHLSFNKPRIILPHIFIFLLSLYINVLNAQIHSSCELHMMSRLWKWYQKCLAVHPVKTQIVSSGFLWGVGDVAATTVTHSTKEKYRQNSDADEEFKINWRRVAITSMFGFGFVGPIGHFWYEGLDRFIRMRLHLQSKSGRSVATKVALDAIIFGPLDLFVFFTYMGFSTGKSVAEVKEDVKRDFLPALVLEGGVWPLLQVANFRFVPVRYQLLYVNVFCLLDSTFLSWIEQQEDAPWKQWFTSFLALEERES
nr:TPA_asm: hypothetical protein HUJ06_028384 [Nelumbo nucifera]